MKKYWKSGFLLVFILIMFTSFFIQTSTVSKGYPQFKFNKIDGKGSVVNDLVINGDLFYGMVNFEGFRVNNEGTTYLRDEPFTKRIKGFYQNLYIEQLQQDYRTFMRGKVGDPDYFYEDKNILAYGATPFDLWTFDNYKFNISVLNKKTNNIVSFSLPIPKRGDYWYVEPYGVYVNGNELSIVTLNETSNNERVAAHIYTFDIKEEQLINEEVIGTLDYATTDNGYTDVSIIKGDNSFLVTGSFISHGDFDERTGYYEESGKLNELLIYNLDTREVKEIKPPETEDIGVPFALNENQLHFANMKEKTLTLTNYDIKKQKITGNLTADQLNTYLSIGDIYQAKVEDGKLYFVPSTQNPEELTSILVADLNNLTIDYIGEIDYINPPQNNNTEVYFNFAELKK